jgi:hypothetical protein
MSRRRLSAGLPVLWIAMFVSVIPVVADERPAVPTDLPLKTLSASGQIIDAFRFDLRSLSKAIVSDEVQLVPRPRVSRSFRPLRRVTLWDGDRFDAELTAWEVDLATFRLQNGQSVRVAATAVAAIENPPAEIDLLDESFEIGASIESSAELRALVDDKISADGARSLKFATGSPAYQCRFPEPLAMGRLEFAFRTGIGNSFADCGGWDLEWGSDDTPQAAVRIRIGFDRRMSVIGGFKETDTSRQSLAVSDGWHSFIAVVDQDRTRLIVDDAILASFPAPQVPLRSILFCPGTDRSANALWIDALQARRFMPASNKVPVLDKASIDGDRIVLATGDELFGRLKNIERSQVSIDTFGATQSLAWTQLSGLSWRQPKQPVQQSVRPERGIVSQIELQPYVDRPDQSTQQLHVTILKSESKSMIVQHSLLGELTIRWSDVRHVRSTFFGESILLDARRFHLGNAIRDDFHRDLPDGTDLTTAYQLHEVPRGRAFLSLDVAELEAAGPTAPPGSPFLSELRAGKLVTEVSVNEQPIGTLNSKIRFRTSCQNPDRIRLEVPGGVLKSGKNVLRLRQKPLKESGREYDDCEVGNFRLEFDLREDN